MSRTLQTQNEVSCTLLCTLWITVGIVRVRRDHGQISRKNKIRSGSFCSSTTARAVSDVGSRSNHCRAIIRVTIPRSALSYRSRGSQQRFRKIRLLPTVPSESCLQSTHFSLRSFIAWSSEPLVPVSSVV
ncbi:hypothetical protein BDR04DRAFT_342037 [Suillus decipiens]|nr:hypothetical protein BDR04DRAFT_342037 [Suillus decipiens]